MRRIGSHFVPMNSPAGALRLTVLWTALLVSPLSLAGAESPGGVAIPGTQPLTLDGDIASKLVDGVDRFLLRELESSTARRESHWRRDFSSSQGYNASIQTNRERLAQILGVRDPRIEFSGLEFVATTDAPSLVGKGSNYDIFAVRWPAFGDVHGEGLLLAPQQNKPTANVVVIPDADQSPEQLAGLEPGIPAEQQAARRLAENGCRVVVPVLINRKMNEPKTPRDNRGAGLSHREFIYRPAFELGRHLIGYEVQKILAVIDWFKKDQTSSRIGVIGWGEGGLLALYAGALDPRIDAVGVSGYFDSRQNIWQEPLDRNVFSLLEQFGDAELAAMIAPRSLVVEAARGPELTLSGKGGGGPARLVTPNLRDVENEASRARDLVSKLGTNSWLKLNRSGQGTGEPYTEATLATYIDVLAQKKDLGSPGVAPTNLRQQFKAEDRHRSQMHELDRHTQTLLAESPYTREKFMKGLDVRSLSNHQANVETYRDFFANEVVGRFDQTRLPANPRVRLAYDKPQWTGYEVVLDVFPDVIAYGVLLLPKDLKPGERRPVVVCQHGLEGRPQHVIEGDQGAYHDFAARLAERGFITFAPQNLYLFTDRFRSLQRKSYPLKKTLFSIIVPQHQQIVDWLATLPWVDPARIAFYGLSYGGKTAMRVPSLVTNYCLSICSADFNEWVWKNASTRSPYSYVWTGEYEIFEFDLGSTFNYAEMAALIAPRPFMVERGHFDGVAPDEMVAAEFAKVRFLYDAKLGMGDRCEIEWFVGPHTINGKGTFDFLQRHLKWAR